MSTPRHASGGAAHNPRLWAHVLAALVEGEQDKGIRCRAMAVLLGEYGGDGVTVEPPSVEVDNQLVFSLSNRETNSIRAPRQWNKARIRTLLLAFVESEDDHVALVGVQGLRVWGTTADVLPILGRIERASSNAGTDLPRSGREAIAEIQARAGTSDVGGLALASGETGGLGLSDEDESR